MPCKVLIRATTNGKWLKGYPVSLLADSTPWGTATILPNFIRINISDANRPKAQHLLDAWKAEFTHEILAQNAQSYRIKISVDQRVIAAFGANAGLKSRIVDALVSYWGAIFVSKDLDQRSAIFDIPAEVNLPALKAWVRDIFEQDVDRKVNYFTDAAVDQVIAAGGEATFSLAQVISKVKNRLTD